MAPARSGRAPETARLTTASKPVTVRGRIRADVPAAARSVGPLAHEIVVAGPLARERFATLWPDTDALRALALAKRAAIPRALADALREYHRRLGASAASLEAIERLARGEVVVAVAGQQPAPLGGPLYSLHKTATTVGLAGEIARRTGAPAVPMFWMHGEDSDFAEIRSATLGDPALVLHDFELPASAHREGGLIGGVPPGPLAALEEQALGHWAGLPGHGEVAGVLTRAHAAARDLGEAYSALMLALFADHGLVVIDPRLPAFRAAARPIIDRYLDRADELTAGARRAGDVLEARAGSRPLAAPALESFVFRIEDGERHKITASEARAMGARAVLTPSVALRPAVQDGVFPTVAMACGAAEASYLAQLREVFEGVGVRPACVVPRLSATWLPPAAGALLEASSAAVEELVFETDAVLRRHAESRVPPAVREALERGRAEARTMLDRIAEAAPAVDASLVQMVESARGKVDYQFERLREGVAAKMRHRIERQHPEWARLRAYLYPGDRMQERRLASLEPVARFGAGIVPELCRLSVEHARRVADGVMEQLVLEP